MQPSSQFLTVSLTRGNDFLISIIMYEFSMFLHLSEKTQYVFFCSFSLLTNNNFHVECTAVLIIFFMFIIFLVLVYLTMGSLQYLLTSFHPVPPPAPRPRLCCCCSVTSVVSNSFATPRTVACQASLSKGFSQQEYWSGLPFHSPGALPGPRLKSKSPALAGRFSTTKPPGKPYTTFGNHKSNLFFCLFLKYN